MEPLEILYNALQSVNPIIGGTEEDPEYLYEREYDRNSQMNVLADRLTRDKCCYLIEELESFTFFQPANVRFQKTLPFSVYFFKFCNFHNRASYGTTPYSDETRDASVTQQEIRNEIQDEIVRPFVELLKAGSRSFYRTLTINVTYPMSRYDGNEVGILLTFGLVLPEC